LVFSIKLGINYVGCANQKPKKTYINISFSYFDNLQHYNNYLNLTRYIVTSIIIVCCQPVCHYAALLLGKIKLNATQAY